MKSCKFWGVLLTVCLYLNSAMAKSQQENLEHSKTDTKETKAETIEQPEETVEQTEKDSRKIIYQNAVNFANWIDRFFGEKEELESAGYDYLRLINNLTFLEGEDPKYRPRIKAKLHLPQLSESTSLLFSTNRPDSNEDLDSNQNENDTLTDEQDDNVSAALNYATEAYANSKFDFRVGIDSSLETFAFIKQSVPLLEKENLEVRSFNYLFWEDEHGFGLATQLEVNHTIDDNNLFRWRYAIRRAEKSFGNEWQNKFSLVNQLSAENWIAYELRVKGDTEHQYDVESYRLSFRYRKKTSTDWLFFEFEPEVRYDRTPESLDRELIAGVTFRLEVQFEN